MQTLSSIHHPHALPRVRTITLDHPWRWLSAGWMDMTVAPVLSYPYGAAFAGIGFMLLVGLDASGIGYLILPMALGFALVGPLAAIGLYETSRRLQAGRSIGFGPVFSAFGRNPAQIGLVGVFLLLAMAAWVRLAIMEFMLFFSGSPPGLGGVIDAVLTSDAGAYFLIIGTITGGMIAAGVFAMTAIAIPMLLDRPDCDAMTAMLTSLEAVRHNWRPMMLWASLIGMFTLFGLAMFFVGLVITLPLIGHASWHAYRDLVEAQD